MGIFGNSKNEQENEQKVNLLEEIKSMDSTQLLRFIAIVLWESYYKQITKSEEELVEAVKSEQK